MKIKQTILLLICNKIFGYILPISWNWQSINGKNMLTKILDQNSLQNCNSCWVYGALSSLADRIKIARKGKQPDIHLSVPFILNCGRNIAGSCDGGTILGTYQFIKHVNFVAFDMCYEYTKCPTFEHCEKNINLNYYPNATISRYGTVSGVYFMKYEIYTNGPIACAINAIPLFHHKNKTFDNPNASRNLNHIVSIVGWIENVWTVKNSWGEHWGHFGFFKIKMGENQLGIEQECSYAIPYSWTEFT